MYVDMFVVGVVFTLFCEMLMLILVSLYQYFKKK